MRLRPLQPRRSGLHAGIALTLASLLGGTPALAEAATLKQPESVEEVPAAEAPESESPAAAEAPAAEPAAEPVPNTDGDAAMAATAAAPQEPPAPIPVQELEEQQRQAAASEVETTSDESDVYDRDEGFDEDGSLDPVVGSPAELSARRWLGAGIAATVTGAVLVGGAIAFSQTAPCDPKAGNNCFTDARDRAAVTMGVPGGLLLLGGIAMTTIGALQKRRLRASVALVPGSYGVVVSGRF